MTTPLHIRRDGADIIDQIINNPALGTQLIVPVPAGQNWLVLAMGLQLITSAVAGNRNMIVDFRNPNNANIWRNLSANIQVASTSFNYWMSQNLPAVDVLKTLGALNFVYFPIPMVYILSGGSIRTTVQGLLGGDSIQSITMQTIVYYE